MKPKIFSYEFVWIISLFFSLKISAQDTTQIHSLYELGEKLVAVARSDNADKIIDLIAPDIDIDKKAEILESFLTVKESLFNLIDVSKIKLFNVIKQDGYTYFIVNNGDKFFIIKSKTKNNKIIDQFALINTKVNELLQKGQKIYKMRCYACHGKDGKGSIGPNLTDPYWETINSEKELENVITNGKKGTMMIAYKDYLKPDDLKAVILYIKAIQGKKVKKPKKPEGEKKNISFKVIY